MAILYVRTEMRISEHKQQNLLCWINVLYGRRFFRYSTSHLNSEMFEWQKALFFISLNWVAFINNGHFQIIEVIEGFILIERFFLNSLLFVFYRDTCSSVKRSEMSADWWKINFVPAKVRVYTWNQLNQCTYLSYWSLRCPLEICCHKNSTVGRVRYWVPDRGTPTFAIGGLLRPL